LIKKIIAVPEKTGFSNIPIKYNELELGLWFLSHKYRHLWRHHYFGTQGVIFIFASKSKNITENLIIEAITILKDKNLVAVPFLFLIDKSNTIMDELDLTENLRSQLNQGEFLYNIQFVNFSNPRSLDEINYGLNWLCSEMKSIN
jgi:GTPase SAR1 family protein